MPLVRSLQDGDIEHLANNLRQADKDEVKASVGLEPLEALRLSCNNSEWIWIVEHEGIPFCIFGLSQFTTEIGVPWMLATNDLYKHKIYFARESIGMADAFLEIFPTLTNMVDERHKESIEWLSWLGFDFPERIEKYGHEGRPFLQFIRNRNV